MLWQRITIGTVVLIQLCKRIKLSRLAIRTTPRSESEWRPAGETQILISQHTVGALQKPQVRANNNKIQLVLMHCEKRGQSACEI